MYPEKFVMFEFSYSVLDIILNYSIIFESPSLFLLMAIETGTFTTVSKMFVNC